MQAFTDVESSLQRAMMNSLGGRDRSISIAGLESISEGDGKTASKHVRKPSRMCQSDTPQPVRLSAARSAAGRGKADPCASTTNSSARHKSRPRGNAPQTGKSSADMYSFAALSGSGTPDLYSSFAAAAPSGGSSQRSSSDAAAEARAASRRNSLQSMRTSAERNNPYAGLASSLGGLNATVLAGGSAGGMANSFASAGARVGGKPVLMGDSFATANARVGGPAMPASKPASRLAIKGSPAGDSFATAGARVGGGAMPKRICEQSIKEGSEGCAADPDIETQRGKSVTAGSSGPAAGCVVKVPNPYAGLLSIDLGAERSQAAAAEQKDGTKNDLTTLSAPLLAAMSSPSEGDDGQPPPNPFASSSSKRSEPQLDGWRQLAG